TRDPARRRRRRIGIISALVIVSALFAQVGADADSRAPVIVAQCAEQGLGSPSTDVNAQAGNGTTTVGINAAGTISVFKYPNPSYYNQVKYFTSGADAKGNPTGALANEGSFAGLLYGVGGTVGFSWLRDLPHTQSYLDDNSAIPVTTYDAPALGLSVTDTDLVAAPPDASFVRSFAVTREAGSPVTSAALVYYEKFSPVASKIPFAPGQDNCLQQLNDQQVARYNSGEQAIVHSWLGVDISTGKPSRVAIAFGWDTPVAEHQVGRDGSDPLAPPFGPADAYGELEAAPHALDGADLEAGQATGALTTPLHFDPSGRATARMVITPAMTADGALAGLDAERSSSFATEEASVARWWKSWIGTASLPEATDPAVLRAAQRALISMRLAVDPDTGAIVASADTESPYGEDWIRDGTFINRALDIAGFASLVTRHDLFEASSQSSLEHPDPLAPFGSWPMNVYGDGSPGGPIPYEIDETGFGAFTLWDHFHYLSGPAGTSYLSAVYPAIARAATWLSTCVDETNGLQCQASEDDSFTPSQTLHGAGPAVLGLRSALAAAVVLGDTSPQVVLWQQRLTQLGSAVDKLYDPSVGAYEEQPGATSAAPVSFADGGWLLWPVQLHPYSDPRMVGESKAVWSAMLTSLNGNSGGYEAKALLGVCDAWSPLSAVNKAKLDGQLHYMATQLTTNTGLFGEWWQRFPPAGQARPMNDIPHIWEGALFYLSAMCVDGPSH
ncbi:MAG TPA: hypothetical protein VFV02_08810, partial [Acidimicrobiales bacterium]|nr:hypothetical protein [Acidimicrobiales bacterium]